MYLNHEKFAPFYQQRVKVAFSFKIHHRHLVPSSIRRVETMNFPSIFSYPFQCQSVKFFKLSIQVLHFGLVETHYIYLGYYGKFGKQFPRNDIHERYWLL